MKKLVCLSLLLAVCLAVPAFAAGPHRPPDSLVSFADYEAAITAEYAKYGIEGGVSQPEGAFFCTTAMLEADLALVDARIQAQQASRIPSAPASFQDCEAAIVTAYAEHGIAVGMYPPAREVPYTAAAVETAQALVHADLRAQEAARIGFGPKASEPVSLLRGVFLLHPIPPVIWPGASPFWME